MMQSLACVTHMSCEPLFKTLTLILFAAILYPKLFGISFKHFLTTTQNTNIAAQIL